MFFPSAHFVFIKKTKCPDPNEWVSEWLVHCLTDWLADSVSELASIWINSLFSFNHKNPPCFSLSFFSFVMGSVCGQFVFIGFYFIFISSYLYLHTHTHTLTNPEVWTYILGAIHSYIYKVYEILPFFFLYCIYRDCPL